MRIPILLMGLMLTTDRALGAEDSSPADRPSVLFLVVDDLNDWVGCLGGHPQVRTPHIDALAERGRLFLNTHCQSPLCNPSRSSVLTGLRPSTTGIYGLAPGIRQVDQLKRHVTLPQAFRRAGYFTYTCGKVYHDGSIAAEDRRDEFEQWGPAPPIPRPSMPFVSTPGKHPAVDWGVFPQRDEDQGDWKIATAAIETLRNAPRDRPFFIACGFRLPHVPCYASQKWFDLYPSPVELPKARDDDRADTPRFSWYLHWKLPEPRLKFLREENQWQPAVRSYLACVSFVDSQVGRVLAALAESGRADDTIVVLWSDHGYHLGEKEITGKNTLWEPSTRVPLIFAGPGVARGEPCDQPVELLDIYPTLLELCELPARDELEGASLMPQLRDPRAVRERPSITTHNQGNHTIRTSEWRYIRYADGSEELYDIRRDPEEWTNLADVAEHAEVKSRLRRWLPKIDRPPTPKSRHRVLTYEASTGEATWEGRRIGRDDPIPEIED